MDEGMLIERVKELAARRTPEEQSAVDRQAEELVGLIATFDATPPAAQRRVLRDLVRQAFPELSEPQQEEAADNFPAPFAKPVQRLQLLWTLAHLPVELRDGMLAMMLQQAEQLLGKPKRRQRSSDEARPEVADRRICEMLRTVSEATRDELQSSAQIVGVHLRALRSARQKPRR